MTFNLSGRTMQINITQSAPSGSGFSTGALQSGGAGKIATISGQQGPFKITLNYAANTGDTNGRYPTIEIAGETIPTPAGSTGTSDPKTFTYTYLGTEVKDIVIKNGSTNPGRIFDVIIENP
jgi:hypothetical protein